MATQNPPETRLKGFDPREVLKEGTPLHLGDGDLVVGASTRQVLGRMTAALIFCRNAEGKPLFQGITVIAPPKLAWNHSDEEIFEMLVLGVTDLRGDPMLEKERERYASMVNIVRCERPEISLALAAAQEAGARQLLLFPESGIFRGSDVAIQSQIQGRSTSFLAEDIWVSHIANLAQKVLPIARKSDSYVVLIASEMSPVKAESRQLLNAVEHLYPAFASFSDLNASDKVLQDRVPRWVALASSGRLAQALAEIDAEDLEPEFKTQIRVQVAARSDDNELTIRLVREFVDSGEKLPTEMAARFARIAYRSGDEPTAKSLIAGCLDSLTDSPLLEALLEASTEMRDSGMVERLWTRLQALYPQSLAIGLDAEVRVLQHCQQTSDSKGPPAPSRVGFTGFQHFFVDNLPSHSQVDYASFLQTVESSWPSQLHFGALCASLHAITWKRPKDALRLAIKACDSPVYEKRAVRTLVFVIRRYLLLELLPKEDLEAYKLPLLRVIQYLATNSDDARTRSLLERALSVEVAGALGLPMLISLTLDIVGTGTQLRPPMKSAEPLALDEFKKLFEQALIWMSHQTVIEPGVTRLPKELVGSDIRGFISSLTYLVKHEAQSTQDDDSLGVLMKYSAMICLLFPSEHQDSSDLDALRVVASRAWVLGHAQSARDIAEQILELAGDNPLRRRIAWACYADIYQRTRSPIDALLGISCAATCNVPAEPADLFQEAYVLLRVARDLHFYDIARNVLVKCRLLAEKQGLTESAAVRLDGIDIGLRLAEVDRSNLVATRQLLDASLQHCMRVIEEEDELFTPASNFFQIAGIYQRHGGVLQPSEQEFLDQLLQKFDAASAEFLRTISMPFPDVKDVLALNNRTEAARNSEDAPSDNIPVTVAAQRLLLPQTEEVQPAHALIAIEVLAERAIELPSGTKPLDIHWPAEYVRQLSLSGVSVLMLAMDEADGLVAVIAEAGDIRTHRASKGTPSFRQRLTAWSEKYPYRYGLIDRKEGNNEFYNTMAEFDIPMPQSDKVLVIAQPVLAQIPYNLVLVENNLAGSSKAIAVIPSLTWFVAARQCARRPDTRLMAWISVPSDPEQFKTLDMVHQRLLPIFQEYEIQVDNSRRIPADMQGSRLAVVTAHGQLTNEARYIHRIADDEDLSESPTALANALKEAELVILFVCSGGRVDQHPHANTTVSLPKLLLDRGCRTVIASPWPMASEIPGNWLERFLACWKAGSTALEANFEANKHVMERLGPESQYCLAMTVYGDALLRV